LPHSRRGRRFWFSAWLPMAIGIGVTMLESTVWFGADRTSQPLRRIWEAIFGHVSNRSWHLIHTCIRKSGHLLGFGLVGLAWLRAWWMSLPHFRFLTDAVILAFWSGPARRLAVVQLSPQPDRCRRSSGDRVGMDGAQKRKDGNTAQDVAQPSALLPALARDWRFSCSAWPAKCRIRWIQSPSHQVFLCAFRRPKTSSLFPTQVNCLVSPRLIFTVHSEF
jgi:hypothetical protein